MSDEKEKKKGLNATAYKQKVLEEQMTYLYDFRYNELTAQPEIKFKKEPLSSYRLLDDYEKNTILRKFRHMGVSITAKNLNEVLKSDFSIRANPLIEYFDSLPRTSGTKNIEELIGVLETTSDKKFNLKYFLKFIVGVVGNVYEKNKCANHLCFVLNGGQGLGKSTFMKKLCPPDIEDYYYEGYVMVDEKDTLFRSACNLIINMDDRFESVTKKQITDFKQLVTAAQIKARRPYATYDETMEKICSFVGTTNDATFLYDPTGSRRFFCLEVISLDYQKMVSIDSSKVFAEAVTLYKSGFKTHLSHDENIEIQNHNKQFESIPFEYDMLSKYYKPCAEDFIDVIWMTNGEIKQALEAYTKQQLNGKVLGQALREMKFKRKQLRKNNKRNWFYAMAEINYLGSKLNNQPE